MGAALHQAEMAAEVLDAAAAAGHGGGVVLLRVAGLLGHDQRGALLGEGKQAERRALPRRADALFDDRAGHRQRNDFHRGHHRPGAHRRERRQRGDGDGLVDGIDPVDDPRIDRGQAALRRVQVAAPGVGAAGDDALTLQRGGDGGGGRVLGQVAGIEARAVDGPWPAAIRAGSRRW
jgi:hypothetical protein